LPSVTIFALGIARRNSAASASLTNSDASARLATACSHAARSRASRAWIGASSPPVAA